jgi:8-oxo-dGTP pyrophosphatase MutT (NUDIX family)
LLAVARRTSCGILVLNAQAQLLLGHATGTPYWDIPKGAAEPDETHLQTAIRETAEECGLGFSPNDLVELGRHPYCRDKDLHLFGVLVDGVDPAECRCRTSFVDARDRIRPEMDAFAWVRFEQLQQRWTPSKSVLLTRSIALPQLLQLLQQRNPAPPVVAA